MAPPPTSPPGRDLGRLPALDGLRGIAALIVVVHHALLASSIALAGFYRGGDVSGVPGALVNTPLSLFWGGREAVFVFFVLSGFVLTLPHARGKEFRVLEYYPARLVRLYLPVWGALIVSAALLLVVGRPNIDDATWWLEAHPGDLTFRRTVADSSLFLAGGFMFFSAIWSLKWEVIFSVLLPAYMALGRAGRALRVALVVGALLAIGSNQNDYLTFLPVFMLGTVIAYEHRAILGALERIGAPARAALLVAALLMVAVTSWGDWLSVGIADALIALGAAAIVALASTLTGAFSRTLQRRPLRWLGSRSFSLYLVHEPIIVALAFATGATVTSAVFVLIALPLALIAAEGFYRAIEHPSHRLARSLKSKTSPPRLAVAK